MATKKKRKEMGDVCRIGMMSRIDYGSGGFRLGFIELAKEDFRKEDVHYVVLAGGLVAAREIKTEVARLKREIKVLERQLKALVIKPPKGTPKDAAVEYSDPEAAAEIERKLGPLEAQLAGYEPEAIAEKLSKLLPHFENAQGATAKLYIIVSPVYDGDIGERVAQHLVTLRADDIRVYKPGSDEFFIKQADARLEVITPTVSPWRGNNDSTGVQGVLRDAAKMRTGVSPDLQAVGCYGVTLTKPEGANRTPWIALPVLHKLQGVRVSENQVGVRVVEVRKGRINPLVRTYSYKDHIGKERDYIALPAGLTANQQKVVKALVRVGELPTSSLADEAGLSREAAERAATALVRDSKRLLKSWPGLSFYEDSKRWDFDARWKQENLRYPHGATKKAIVESIVMHGCLHAGAVQTDYRFFIEEIPRVMLATDATVLVHAGDLIEGLKHNLILRGEVYGGLNVTSQEALAGEMIAKVTIDVFKPRFLKAFADLMAAKKGARLTRDEIAACVEASLPVNVLIPGNHDEWVIDFGMTPLVGLKHVAALRIHAAIEHLLAAKDVCCTQLMPVVRDKIVLLPNFGVYVLPSGLRASIQHPHMGNATTESIRIQASLRVCQGHKSEPGCQIAIQANFHTAFHLETWNQSLGQRIGVQCGTGKHSTDFEIRKMKIVDHGFAHLTVSSLDQRIIGSEISFYGNDPAKTDLLDQGNIFEGVLKKYNLG